MQIRRALLCFIFLHVMSLLARGQDYFQKIYTFHQPSNPSSFDVNVLPDGKIAMLSGTMQPQDSTGQCNLLLLDTRGDIIWSKLLVSGKSSYSATLALAPDGNLLVGLNSFNLADAALTTVVKVSAGTGDILWESHFSLPSSTYNPGIITTRIVRIIPLTGGGCAVLAAQESAPFLSHKGLTLVFKLDENGNIVWEKTWANAQEIRGLDIAENSAGEIYIAGDRAIFSPGRQSMLIKLSPDGVPLWNKVYDDVYVRHVSVDAADDLWLSGFYTNSSDPGRNFWVQKSSGEAITIWSKLYALDPLKDLGISNLVMMPNGDAVISGHHELVGKSNTVLARINPAGTMLWVKKYAASGKNDYLVSIAPSLPGDIVAGGFSGETYTTLNSWLLKTDGGGNIPDCCLASASFSATDIAPPVAPVDLLTTDTLVSIPGSTISVVLPPDVITYCTPGAIPASPNAFTPNDDQVNDAFLPRFACPPETIRLMVYNRWGNKVFETLDVHSTGWDGRVNGKDAVTDTYAWFLEYETFISGNLEKKQDKGDVTLIR